MGVLGPQVTAPTPLRTVTTQDREAMRESIVKDAAATAGKQLKAHLKTELTAAEQRMVETIMKRTSEEVFARTAEHLQGKGFWRGAIAGILAGAGLAILATVFVYERAGMWGATLERFESSNAELKAMEDKQ